MNSETVLQDIDSARTASGSPRPFEMARDRHGSRRPRVKQDAVRQKSFLRLSGFSIRAVPR
jgi:hypothetical protein